MEETDELLAAAALTEKALSESRSQVREKLRRDEESLLSRLRAELEKTGHGSFESLTEVEAFICDTPGTEPLHEDAGERPPSPRVDAYWEWMHFNHSRDHEHRVELSERPTLFARYGTVVALHALLELALQDFCHVAQQRRKSALALEDLAKGRRDGFKERTYLEKVHGIEVEPALWESLGPLVFVRNRIAHSNGRISGQRPAREIAMLTGTPGLSLRGDLDIRTNWANGTLHVEPEFLAACESRMYALLKALETAMSEWDRLRPVKR
jgi:hypothetical protein